MALRPRGKLLELCREPRFLVKPQARVAASIRVQPGAPPQEEGGQEEGIEGTSTDEIRPEVWDSPILDPADSAAMISMSTWLETKVSPHPCMAPVLDLFKRALSGHPIDMSRDEWASMIPDAIKADGPLAGCLSRHYDQWRETAPDRRDLWRMLRNGWHDPKVDPDHPHAATSAAPPPRSKGQIAIERQCPKMQQMGVMAPVMDPPVSPISSDRFHILRNAPQEKKDEHGNVTDEVRVVTATKSESSNEDMPRHRGTSPDDFSRWIKPRQVTLKGDLSKMFWQVNATKSQRDLMMFHWGDQIFQWTVMVMGMAGSGCWATSITNVVRSHLLVRFLIDIFTFVDEWAIQNLKLLINCLEQAFTVTTLVWLGARPNVAKTQLAFTADRVPTIALFIGIMANSMLNRVSPSPARMGVIREQAAFILREFHSGRKAEWSELRQPKARVTSCSRIHMLAGFLSVRMSTVHRQFLQKHGSSKPAHASCEDPQLGDPVHGPRAASLGGQPRHRCVAPSMLSQAVGDGGGRCVDVQDGNAWPFSPDQGVLLLDADDRSGAPDLPQCNGDLDGDKSGAGHSERRAHAPGVAVAPSRHGFPRRQRDDGPGVEQTHHELDLRRRDDGPLRQMAGGQPLLGFGLLPPQSPHGLPEGRSRPGRRDDDRRGISHVRRVVVTGNPDVDLQPRVRPFSDPSRHRDRPVGMQQLGSTTFSLYVVRNQQLQLHFLFGK